MSKESSEWLNTQTLIGFTEKRGNAWHYREGAQGEESNHYANAIPVEDVHRRLFHWQAVEATSEYTLPDGRVFPSPQKTIARSDTGAYLGAFMEGYRPHQYGEWLVTHVENILDESLSIGSAGLLKGGRVAW